MSDSIWKKEISLRRRPKDEAAPAPEPAADEPKQSIWKKEISLGRKKQQDGAPDDEAVARLVQLATQAVAPDFNAPVAPVAPVEPPTQVAEAVVAAQPDPVGDDVHPVETLPVDEPVPFELPPPPSFAPVDSAPVDTVPTVVPVPPAPAPADLPAHPLEAGPVEPWMEPEPEPEPAEPWPAAPELPPPPEADTAVVVHPPVAAAELPPPAEQRTAFWKKELSFSRAPRTPKAPKAPKPEGTPFWKKELSLARAPKAPQEPKGDGVPFWKRDLSFSRPKRESAPRARRSLPSLSLPTFSRGRGHQVKRLVGLKVGGSQIAAARIANNGAAELLQLARTDLDPGVVVAGEVRDVDSLANALKTFFAANKLPRKGVRLGIASNRIGVRTFEIAGIDDEKQLENAIHFRAQEALPIPLDEAVLDYHVLEERVDEEGTSTKRVLLVVAYRELVDRYVAACRKAGITLAGIDLEAFALLRAISAPRPAGQPGDSALVAVAIGHDRSTFAVSDGRVCEFTRVLEWGGSAISVAIARALDLAPSEVEGVKRAVSLTSPDVPEGLTPEQYAHAVDAVRKQVQGFARELVSSLQFYQNQPGSLGIGEIVVTGGTASLVGLADELQRLIGVRVRVGDPLARLKAKKVAVDGQLGSLAVAIGLGIED